MSVVKSFVITIFVYVLTTGFQTTLNGTSFFLIRNNKSNFASAINSLGKIDLNYFMSKIKQN